MEEGKHSLYYIAFRVVRFKVSDENGENYQSVITNLPRCEFSAADIKDIYAKRWGIETSFRELKYDIGITNFHSKKVDFIIQEIFAKLILYNFCLIINMHVVIEEKDTKYQYKVNISMAIPVCIAFFIRSGVDPPMNVEKLIGRYIDPIRPGRKFPRFVKSRGELHSTIHPKEKNWLFSGSPEGDKASAAVYSIIETAKSNNINPYDYLLYIFKFMPGVRFDEEPE